MTNEELDAIYERANKATPEPWVETVIMGETWIVGPDVFNDAVMRIDYAELSFEDTEFITHARTDILALLAEVDCLRNQLQAHMVLGGEFDM